MRKFKKQQETEQTEDLFEGLFDDVDLEAQEEAVEEDKKKEEEETFNPNGLPMVLERIEAGLIGSYKVLDDMNFPIIKKGDILQLRKQNRLQVRDFILYKVQNDYFIRRIIKFKELDIYVAGDHEKEYHITHKENVIAKAVGRERGKHYLSLSLNPKFKFYTFSKVNLAFIRLGKRVTSYEEEQNEDAFDAAMQKLSEESARVEAQQQTPQYDMSNIDLDSDLADFLDPNDLVKELHGETTGLSRQPADEEEEVVYVDEDGEEIESDESDESDEEEEEGEAVEYIEEGSIGDGSDASEESSEDGEASEAEESSGEEE